MPVTDSSTGEVIAVYTAFEGWAQLSLSKRMQMMFKWHDILKALEPTKLVFEQKFDQE